MKWFVVLLLACLVLIGLSGYMDHKEDQQWRAFSAQHHCRIVVSESAWRATTWQCDGFQVEHR